MTYRISSFLLALVLLGTFVPAAAAHAAEPRVVHVTIKPGAKPPTCQARATKRRVEVGKPTTLVWSSKHADTMYGITKDGEWNADGRQNVSIGFVGKKVFKMVFIGEGGITTCSAIVHSLPKKD